MLSQTKGDKRVSYQTAHHFEPLIPQIAQNIVTPYLVLGLALLQALRFAEVAVAREGHWEEL